MAVDCLAGYLYTEEIEGNALPAATALDKVDIHCEDDDDSDYVKAFVNLVSVDVKEYARQHFNKPVKKTLTIPQWLNDTAVRRKVNFSKVLQRGLMAELNLQDVH